VQCFVGLFDYIFWYSIPQEVFVNCARFSVRSGWRKTVSSMTSIHLCTSCFLQRSWEPLNYLYTEIELRSEEHVDVTESRLDQRISDLKKGRGRILQTLNHNSFACILHYADSVYFTTLCNQVLARTNLLCSHSTAVFFKVSRFCISWNLSEIYLFHSVRVELIRLQNMEYTSVKVIETLDTNHKT
jgi:hypothetical protein